MTALRASCLLAILSAGALSGASLTAPCTTPALDFTASTPQALGSRVCPQVDPSLGTLRSVQLSPGTWSVSGLTLWDNSATGTVDGPFSIPLSVTVGPVPNGSAQAQFTLIASVPGSLTGGQSSILTVVPLPFVAPGVAEATSPPSLAGTGTILIPVVALVGLPASPPDLQDYRLTATADSASITYTFTPIPEPSSLGLLLTALGVGLSRWRRGRRSAAGSSR